MLVDLTGSDAHHPLDGVDEDLAIAHFTGSRSFDDGRNGFFGFLRLHANLQQHLGHKSGVELRANPAAGALAYALGVKNMATLNVEFYTGVDERLDEPLILPPVPDLSLLRTERLLVVDDVADTGRTLALARDFCAQYVDDVRTAVLYEKPQSVVRSDFVWRRTDRWINFPWSTPAAVGAE